jgi:predicted RecB family nuclease
MKKVGASFELTATDLVGYLNCHHLSDLDRAVAEGSAAKPTAFDPLLTILWERGLRHEINYIEHLTEAGLGVVRINGADVAQSAVSETLAAMKQGVPVIAQGAMAHQGWGGRADILRRVEIPSALGQWSYEAIDTKLSRETKAGAVLQLCVYSDLLSQTQDAVPENMHVVAPWSDFQPRTYRFADYAAYFRKVKRGFLAMLERDWEETYPEPNAHCEICRWEETCDKRRRADDHLCLVAGISKVQINELKQHGIATMKALADMALPLNWKPARGSIDSLSRVCEQARLQVEARESGERKHIVLPVEPGFGLARLPEPSAGDIFFDLEGDPFVGEHGLEYLFGYQFNDERGHPVYRSEWAFTRTDEKRAFESFVDFVIARWQTNSGLHIYHYAPYEPAAMKRLMGRYATRQEEIDRFFRAGLFIDLFQVVRHSIRASVESYSIKQLEPFYAFEREAPLSDANVALANLQANLELDDIPSIGEETKAAVRTYNKDDCSSAAALRAWLETIRAQLVDNGDHVPRPVPGDGAPNEKITDWLIRINALMQKLTTGVPDDPQERSQEQQASWILANVLDFHRREEKAVWWELFRLAALSAEDLLDERAGLSGLTFMQDVGGTENAPVHRYSFPPQETELRGGEGLRNLGGNRLGTIEAISLVDRTVDIKKRKDCAVMDPRAVFAHDYIDAQVKKDALVRFGDYVAVHGLGGDGPYRAARDLLLRERPPVEGQPLHRQGETTVEAAVRLCQHLEGGILPIQGPPGAGKTYTGARMICELVQRGKTVGVTAS